MFIIVEIIDIHVYMQFLERLRNSNLSILNFFPNSILHLKSIVSQSPENSIYNIFEFVFSFSLLKAPTFILQNNLDWLVRY